MAKNMGWQTSRVTKSSLTFPSASRKLEAPVTVECSSVMRHHIAFPTTMLHS